MILLASLSVGVVAYLGVGLATGFTPSLGRLTRPAPDPGHRQVWLLQAGSDLSVAQFVAGSVAAGVATLAVVGLLTGDPLVAVVPAVAAGLIPAAFFGRRRQRRLLEVQQAWPDGVRHIIGGIQAGLSLPQAIAGLATSGPEPLRAALDRFSVNARMLGVPAALEAVKAQLADPTSDRVLEVLLLAYEQGGRIVVDVLADLAEATARDLKTLEEIASDQVEPKINSWAVFALPWLVLVLLTASQPAIRRFYATPAGAAVIVLAALMSLVGILIVYRLSRQPAEQRVLAGPARAAGGAR